MPGIKITGTFIPNDPLDTYGLMEDTHYIGGYRTVETIEDRDNIPDLRRKFGMLVYVVADGTTYVLTNSNSNDLADNANWAVYSTGDGTSGTRLQKIFEVTSPYTANESISIVDGSGSNSGAANILRDEADITTLGDTEQEFRDNTNLQILLNGAFLCKYTEVSYVDQTHFSININMDLDDIFEIRVR